MIKGYSVIPENWGNIAPYVNRGSLVQSIFLSKKCFCFGQELGFSEMYVQFVERILY